MPLPEQAIVQGAGALYEYGILGILMAVCIAYIFWLHKGQKEETKDQKEEIRKLLDDHRQDRKAQDQIHFEERKMWQQSADKVADKLTQLAVDIKVGSSSNNNNNNK